jgi:hypothetical protein
MKVNVTEVKVKASAIAALVVSLVGTTILGTTVTDYVPALPDLLEAPAYSVIAAAMVWLAGFRARNVAGKLAPSTVQAVEEQVAKRLNKRAEL